MALNPLSARERQVETQQQFELAALQYPTLAALADALPTLAQGRTVLVAGQPMIVDATATGVDSAGIDGVRRADRLENLFLAAHFTTQDDTTVNISTSVDGVNFSLLNSAVLPGGGDFALSQRDPAITWFAGWWWIFGTGNAAGSHDFVAFRSRDLTNWSKHQIAMTGGPYASTTVPMPGGTVPATAIWAPQPYIEGDRMFIMLSIRYAADFTGVFGTTQFHFRPYYCECTNPDALTFSAPVAMDFAPGYPANVRQWRADTGSNGVPTLPLVHQGSTTAGWGGFETTLMEHLSRAYPGDTVLLVPAGKGGSGFLNSEWTPGGAARNEFTARLNAALAANPGATIEGMFWQQAEADRNNPDYQTQLTAFFDYVRTTWTALATRPVVFGEMGRFVAAGSIDVNAVISAVAATRTNYGVASSDGLGHKGDALHFNANGFRDLGDRHFAAWRARRGTLPGGSGAVRIFIIAGQSNAVGWDLAYRSYAAGVSMIDASVVRHDGRYYCAIKDDAFRMVRIYSASALAGPWAFIQALGDTSIAIEAPCLVRVRDWSAVNSGVRRDRFLLCVDNNRTGPTDPTPNILVGAPYLMEAIGSPANDFGPLRRMYFETPVRHGSVINLSEMPQGAAASLAASAAGAKAPRPALARQAALSAGSAWISPQPDMTYYVDGFSGATDLTVRDGPADRFYLAVFAASSAIGINVLNAAAVQRGFLLGFGRGNDQIIEMRRRGDGGGYYPMAIMRQATFRAHKNGVDQSVPAGTETKITFGTEAFDRGSYFNPTLSRWTPPRGVANMRVKALVSGLDNGQNNVILIRKNGVILAQSFFVGSGNQATGEVTVSDEPCSGTDYFEAFLLGNGGTGKIIRGFTYSTEFTGECW